VTPGPLVYRPMAIACSCQLPGGHVRPSLQSPFPKRQSSPIQYSHKPTALKRIKQVKSMQRQRRSNTQSTRPLQQSNLNLHASRDILAHASYRTLVYAIVVFICVRIVLFFKLVILSLIVIIR
jgi:hypothetical protein